MDGGDQGVLGGHGVPRLPLADDLRRGDPLPDLDVSPAPPDVDRDVAQFRYLQQDIVAQLGGIHGKPVCSEPHPELVQRPQDFLLGYRLIPPGAEPLRGIRHRVLGSQLGVPGGLHLHHDPAGLEAAAAAEQAHRLRHGGGALEGHALFPGAHPAPLPPL